jgi:hypothetical protein
LALNHQSAKVVFGVDRIQRLLRLGSDHRRSLADIAELTDFILAVLDEEDPLLCRSIGSRRRYATGLQAAAKPVLSEQSCCSFLKSARPM